MEAVFFVIGFEILEIEEEIDGVFAVGGDIIEQLCGLCPEVEHIVDAGQLVLDGDLAQVGVDLFEILVLERL